MFLKSSLMKVCLFLLPLMGVSFAAPANNGNGQSSVKAGKLNWYTNYSQAVAEAKKSNKPLLLFFTGSDWCGWCKKIDQEVFSSPEFVKAAGNDFVFVDLDFPMNKKSSEDLSAQNNALKKKYGVTGFPTIVILDSQENFIAETGYKAPEGGKDPGKSYALYLKELIK